MPGSGVFTLSPTAKAGLSKSHGAAAKAEIWAGETLLATFNMDPSSSLTTDRTGAQRRTGSVTMTEGAILNPDGSLARVVPQTASDIVTPYGNELVLYRGVRLPDGSPPEYVQQCVLSLDKVVVADTRSDLLVTVTAKDRSAAVTRAGFIDTYTIPPNRNIGTEIKKLISACPTGFTHVFNFASVSFTTGSVPLVYHRGEDPWRVCVELAKSVGCDLFYDRGGVCVMIPTPNPWTTPVVANYDEGQLSPMNDLTRTITRDGANYIVREGASSSTAPLIVAIAQDTNPFSPTRVSGPFGRVEDYQQSSLFATQAQAQAAADNDLLKSLGCTETLAINAVPKPDHDVDDVIEVTRTRAGLVSDFYVIDGYTMNFHHGGVMGLNLRQIASIVAP